MRALLLTVLGIGFAAIAGIGWLAISPAPERASDSMTLVIETGSISPTRSAANSGEPAGGLGENAGAPKDRANAPSLDEVIAARLREANSRDQANTAASGETGAAPAGKPAPGSQAADAKPAATGALQRPASTEQPAEADFAAPAESNPPPGTVSITQMLAAELNSGEPTSDSQENGPADEPAQPASAQETSSGQAEPSAASGVAMESQSAQGIAPTGEPAAAPDAPDSSEQTAIAALDPRIVPDTPGNATQDTIPSEAAETPEPSEVADTPGAAEETADESGAQTGFQPQLLAAGEAPPIPRKRGGFRLRGKIALIIRGLGVKPELTEQAIAKMPTQVAMAFVPYGEGLETWTERAKRDRHDVLIQIPLEPENYPETNPGPHTLLTSLSIDENLKRLDWLLDRFDGIAGVTNYLGGKFAGAPGSFAPILMELRARNLLYVDDSKAANATTRQLAKQVSLAYSVADVVIDRNREPAAIAEELTKLEATARANGSAIAIGHAHGATLSALESWLETLNDKGLALVPVSSLVQSPPSRVSQSTGG